jgi:hypothetical protein
MKIFILSLLSLFVLPATGKADMKIASIPDVNVTPSLQSVLRQKDNMLKTQEKDIAEQNIQVSTNGYILDGGNIIVDSLTEPKCVFYGNYNEGSSEAFQYIDIDTLVLNCQ